MDRNIFWTDSNRNLIYNAKDISEALRKELELFVISMSQSGVQFVKYSLSRDAYYHRNNKYRKRRITNVCTDKLANRLG